MKNACLVLLLAALAGCAEDPLLPPPPLTPEQIEQEATYLQARFFADPCFGDAVVQASEADPARIEPQHAYSVSFPVNPLVRDGYRYTLDVIDASRAAYLWRSGGFAGGTVVTGPFPLAACLQPLFREQAQRPRLTASAAPERAASAASAAIAR